MTETKAMTRAPRALPPDMQAAIDERKARNAMVTQIRGTIWSKDLSDGQMRAIAEYARQNALDPVRHLEVLGGRIYLTSTLYEERAAPLIRDGQLVPHEPDFINADPRLDDLAAKGDEWAIAESTRRIRLRIQHNVPEKAEAAVVYRITVASTGQTIVGVNWCGKGLRMKRRKDGSQYDDDPVGGAEPAKTAITRAGRRAWKQVVEAVPALGGQFASLEAGAEVVGKAILVEEERHAAQLAEQPRPRALAAEADGAYGLSASESMADAGIGDDVIDVDDDVDQTADAADED